MRSEVRLQCRCGAVHGVLHNVSTGKRAFCYCRDCQAYVRFLDRPDAVDALGGSDAYAAAPADVKITEGREHLRCVRLSEKGLFRWYSECCKTPLGNSVGPRVPFISVLRPFTPPDETGRSRDEVFGPPFAKIFGRDAIGGCPSDAQWKPSPSFMWHAATIVLGGWLRRQGRPSPFLRENTKEPLVTPKILTKAERAALYPSRPRGTE